MSNINIIIEFDQTNLLFVMLKELHVHESDLQFDVDLSFVGEQSE